MASVVPELPSLAPDQAFESLYRRYVDDVYRYALALLRNPADAEDVTQTTFLNAYRAVKRGERIEKPQNWLIKIAHNAARTRYARAARRVDEVPLDDHLEQLAVPEVERVQVHEVLDALGRLPLNQRAALVMRELEGRTYVEIADTLGVSQSAVETLIFRARRSLRVKASAVRVLGIVPAPGWLWNLLEGGGLAGGGAAGVGGAVVGSGAAAGGGSIVGSGLLLKAAVAVVAAVVASGINSDRPRQADAARRPVMSVTSVASTTNGANALSTRLVGGQGAQPVGAAASGVAGPAATGSFAPGAELGVAPNGRPVGVPQSSAAQTVVVGSGTAAGGVEGSAAPSRATPASAVGTAAQVVATTVSAVAGTVPLPAVPSVSVGVPAVPSVPVQVPQVPVQVPSPPAQVPSPPPVKVPSPPVQLPPPPVQLPPPPVPLPHP